MYIFKLILDNIEWLFSGIGLRFIEIFMNNHFGKKNSIDFINVTLAPQIIWEFYGENSISINKNDIESIVEVPNDEKFKTIIYMKDKFRRYNVIETRKKILKKM